MRVRDPALNAYVKNVACRAAEAYCKDLRVYIMNVPAFNASMAPNGMMIVWTGSSSAENSGSGRSRTAIVGTVTSRRRSRTF